MTADILHLRTTNLVASKSLSLEGHVKDKRSLHSLGLMGGNQPMYVCLSLPAFLSLFLSLPLSVSLSLSLSLSVFCLKLTLRYLTTPTTRKVVRQQKDGKSNAWKDRFVGTCTVQRGTLLRRPFS